MSTTTTAEAERHRRAKRLSKIQEALVGYGFVSIPMALFLVLNIAIFFYAIYISTFKWGIMGARGSVGIKNYQNAFRDPI